MCLMRPVMLLLNRHSSCHAFKFLELSKDNAGGMMSKQVPQDVNTLYGSKISNIRVFSFLPHISIYQKNTWLKHCSTQVKEHGKQM